MQQTIPSAAHKKAADIFSTISTPNSILVIQALVNQQELSSKQLAVITKLSISQVHRVMANLIVISLARKETMGVEVIYKLVHGRLETINAAAARLL